MAARASNPNDACRRRADDGNERVAVEFIASADAVERSNAARDVNIGLRQAGLGAVAVETTHSTP